MKTKQARTEQMVSLYRQGKVLDDIAPLFGLTRERVRQIIRAAGVQSDEGGGRLRTLQRIRGRIQAKVELAEKRERRARSYYGCTYAELQALGPLLIKTSPAHKFRQQKCNARRRKIQWNLTLPEWWRIWSESGKWSERGQGSFCMSRYGDTGPYSVENVHIITSSENIKEYQETPRAKENWARVKLIQATRSKDGPCRNGHPSSERNRFGNCRKCEVIRKAKYHAKKKAQKRQ